jgi:tyrosinase
MRYSLILAATTVSGSVLPRATFGDAPNLPSTDVPHFQVVSFEDAQAKHGNSRIQEVPLAANTTAAAATPESEACAANPSVHVEWRKATAADRQGLISAVLCLMGKPASGNFPPSTSLYEDMVRLHQALMPQVHQNAKFLPWHRYYLWTFEQLLRDECSLAGPMLWWDETLDAGKFGQSDIFTPRTFGSIKGGNPTCVADGPLAGLILHIGLGTSNTPHCLTRGVKEGTTALCSSQYVNLCAQNTDYASFESCFEGG